MKRTSNIDYIEKLFINIKKLNLIENTRINKSTTLAINEKKKIIKKRNQNLKNNFEII